MKFLFLPVLAVLFYFINLDTTNEIKVIKFMESVNEYPYSINEKTFWLHKEEHAFIKILNYDLVDDVKNLTNKGEDMILDVKYAFLIKNNKKSIDTLYTDESLKTWIFKKGKKYQMYYDDKDLMTTKLRRHYSFFKDCW